MVFTGDFNDAAINWAVNSFDCSIELNWKIIFLHLALRYAIYNDNTTSHSQHNVLLLLTITE
jgi:hypothetical protein